MEQFAWCLFYGVWAIFVVGVGYFIWPTKPTDEERDKQYERGYMWALAEHGKGAPVSELMNYADTGQVFDGSPSDFDRGIIKACFDLGRQNS
jgi:hypothetical protein